MDQKERKLWVAAKLAVRAHAKDRSKRNAIKMELAWEELRQYNTWAIWHQMRRQWQERDTRSSQRSLETRIQAMR
jgi:hypothetical protein